VKRLLALVALVFGGSFAWADTAWVLQSGPESVSSIPVTPVQPVPAWRGLYDDGTDQVWVYVTNSPNFFKPSGTNVQSLVNTPWTLVAFFPAPWTPAQRAAWLDRWVTDFSVLATLPNPGWPVLFPSVLRKG
jgi:hypothetical protein